MSDLHSHYDFYPSAGNNFPACLGCIAGRRVLMRRKRCRHGHLRKWGMDSPVAWCSTQTFVIWMRQHILLLLTALFFIQDICELGITCMHITLIAKWNMWCMWYFSKRNISEFWLGQQKISCAQRLYMICCGLQWQRNSGADLEILFPDSIRFGYNELWQQAPVLTRFALTYHMLLQQYHHHPGGNCHNKLYPEWWWWVK